MNLNGQVVPMPFVVDVKEAGRLLGIKETKVYDLLRKREFASRENRAINPNRTSGDSSVYRPTAHWQ